MTFLSKNNNGWKIQRFDFNLKNLQQFSRLSACNNDCVVNAYEFVGLISKKDAKAARERIAKNEAINKKAGKCIVQEGIPSNEYLTPLRTRFTGTKQFVINTFANNFNSFVKFCLNHLRKDQSIVIFVPSCINHTIDQNGKPITIVWEHIMIIARSQNGMLHVIDGQYSGLSVPFTDPQVKNYFSGLAYFNSIFYKNTPLKTNCGMIDMDITNNVSDSEL